MFIILAAGFRGPGAENLTAAERKFAIEHIALSEDLIKEWMHGAFLQPATPERKSEEKYTPETLIAIVTDRSQNRAKTGGPWVPEGNFPNTAAAIQDLSCCRRMVHVTPCSWKR